VKALSVVGVTIIDYLRHPALAFWVIVCVALGGVFFVAVEDGHAGDHGSAAHLPPAQIGVISSLRVQLSTLPSAAHSGGSALTKWSNSTTAMAEQASANYIRDGGKRSDPIDLVYLKLGADSQQLAGVANSGNAAIGAAETKVLDDGDVLVSLIPAVGADQSNNQGLP